MRESKHAEKGALYTVLTAAATVISGFLFVPAVTDGIMYITQGKNAGNAIAGVVLIIVCAAVAAAVMLLWRKHFGAGCRHRGRLYWGLRQKRCCCRCWAFSPYGYFCAEFRLYFRRRLIWK